LPPSSSSKLFLSRTLKNYYSCSSLSKYWLWNGFWVVKIINKGLEFIGKASAERGGASGEGSTEVGRPGGVWLGRAGLVLALLGLLLLLQDSQWIPDTFG